MRLYSSLTAMLICLSLSPAACHSTRESRDKVQAPSTTQEALPSDGVRRVSLAEAQDALGKGEAVVVDVRSDVEYKLGHIKGALLMPLGLIATRASELPRDKLIVTYCAWTHEQISARAVQQMKQHGIERAAALLGGLDAWAAAGLPTEISEEDQK